MPNSLVELTRFPLEYVESKKIELAIIQRKRPQSSRGDLNLVFPRLSIIEKEANRESPKERIDNPFFGAPSGLRVHKAYNMPYCHLHITGSKKMLRNLR